HRLELVGHRRLGADAGLIPGAKAAEVRAERVPGVVEPVHEAQLASERDACLHGAAIAAWLERRERVRDGCVTGRRARLVLGPAPIDHGVADRRRLLLYARVASWLVRIGARGGR